jgi:hypothetical protein
LDDCFDTIRSSSVTHRDPLDHGGCGLDATSALWPAGTGDVQFSAIFDQINAGAEGKTINVVNPGVLAHART